MGDGRRMMLGAAARAAAPCSLPIATGFVFLGITCGVYSVSLGLPWWIPTLMSVCIFTGSAEFITASLLVGAFLPVQAFVISFVVSARHLFYGLSMLGRYRGLGRKRGYLIYAMCDETFAVNYATEPPAGVDRGWFMFFVSLFNQASWVVGCTLGGAVGSALALNVRGVSFAMTALFTVIFVDQWIKEPAHAPSVAGVALSAGAVALFGADGFMIPALAAILAAVSLMRSHLEPRLAAQQGAGGTAAGGAGASAEDACGASTGEANALGSDASTDMGSRAVEEPGETAAAISAATAADGRAVGTGDDAANAGSETPAAGAATIPVPPDAEVADAMGGRAGGNRPERKGGAR